MAGETQLGVDISKWQGDLDLRKVVEAGAKFCIIKATEGTGYVDPLVRRHDKAARRAGILRGFYHYLWRDDPEEQAEHFVRTVRAVAGSAKGVLLALDVERAPEPAGEESVRAFHQRFKELLPKRRLILYTGGWYWRGHIGDPSIADLGMPLWNAYYVGAKGPLKQFGDLQLPRIARRGGYGGYDRATIVQFTSSARVDGRRIDANLFAGPFARLQALAGIQAPLGGGDDETEEETPELTLEQKLAAAEQALAEAEAALFEATGEVRERDIALQGIEALAKPFTDEEEPDTT